ncbi:hypothetical protein PV328_004153 [Microctonus aethiopoides]|uniref:Uncharacterized protein n=1 Tax=Microctonus aethiopoides TaxID=144406 RepID=A0AA39F9Z9_9HYME|nr:hypothetical protein PV328_004153 [Microctonus aethiopoides]
MIIDTCFIYEALLLDSDVVEVRRGLETLKNSCIARGDGKNKYLKTVTFVNVHSNCRKNCTNNLSITAFKRCQEELSTSVSPQVSTLAFEDTVLKTADARDDKYGRIDYIEIVISGKKAAGSKIVGRLEYDTLTGGKLAAVLNEVLHNPMYSMEHLEVGKQVLTYRCFQRDLDTPFVCKYQDIRWTNELCKRIEKFAFGGANFTELYNVVSFEDHNSPRLKYETLMIILR